MPDDVAALLDEAMCLLRECEEKMQLYSGTYALRNACRDARRQYTKIVKRYDEARK